MVPADILFAAASVYSVVASTVALIYLHKIFHPPVTRVFAECSHCHTVITQYFIDGYGRTTCKTCKPEGFADAERRGIAKL